ncbi:MAG: 5'/3'-nucleotidase SurE [Synergistaceae bacterium]|jgi:5'-nucleotidase|nr:5'/3'-nucleotidase SurE [Synergistaceae bacterium]
MKILISNDDGVHAPGIIFMSNRLAELGHAVTVVAPDRERSGAGHSVTTTSLHLKRGTFPGYDPRVRTFKCNGTPADSTLLGLGVAAPDAELVLAGINSGPNMGRDVFYSGTVAAAREGYFENRGAIAMSLAVEYPARDEGTREEEHYETAVRVSEILVENLNVFFGGFGENGGREAALLNVNVPNLPLSEIQGFKMTFTGRRRYRDRVQRIMTPRGDPCYWIQGAPADSEELEGSDVKAVNDGFVALTFLQYDTTDYGLNDRVGAEEIDKLKINQC